MVGCQILSGCVITTICCYFVSVYFFCSQIKIFSTKPMMVFASKFLNRMPINNLSDMKKCLATTPNIAVLCI